MIPAVAPDNGRPLADGQDIALQSLAFPGWVGIFIPAPNLIPIGQSDGGHILYSLLPRRVHPRTKNAMQKKHREIKYRREDLNLHDLAVTGF